MVRDEIRKTVAAAIQAAQADDKLPAFDVPAVELTRPKQAEHGDYSTNVAMVAAAAVRKLGANANPREIAQVIGDHIPAGGPVGKVEMAGPGFINIRFNDAWIQEQVGAIVAAGPTFGNLERGRGQRWQVEYVSANPTGPIHYGGARNAVLGDALANVLAAAGYEVQREYYVNDAGTQFGLFVDTLYVRYLHLFGREEALPAEGYQGEYMIGYAQRVRSQHGDHFLTLPRAEALRELRPIAVEIVVSDLKAELAALGVTFDRWFHEQSLFDDGLVDQMLAFLRQKGDIGDRDGAVWFLASNYKENVKDEVLIRSSGAPTYFTSDIAYHYEKFVVRQFDHVVDVVSFDHQGHAPRMATMMQALGLDPSRLTILLYGLVKLVRDGQEVKLSKRKGNLLTIRDVVEEVGADAVRFNLLTRGPESTIEFDLDLAVAQEADNPVFYAQYSHARICSILKKAAEKGFDPANAQAAELHLLVHSSELALIRKLLELEEQVELAVEKLSPHNLTHYAIELSRGVNGFYRDCHVLDPEHPDLTLARLQLSRAVQVGLQKTLSLIRRQRAGVNVARTCSASL